MCVCVCVFLWSVGCGGKREGFIKYNYRDMLNYVEGRREGGVFIFYGDEGGMHVVGVKGRAGG